MSGLNFKSQPRNTTVPTIQRFLSGTSQTYTTPAGVLYLRVRMLGGGGGGAGSGTAAGTAAADGVDSVFGNLTAGKGIKGVWNAGGAAGGAVTVGAGWTNVASTVGSGSFGFIQEGSAIEPNAAPGGWGGIGALGGQAAAAAYGAATPNATANTGSGGQGGGPNAVAASDAGTGGGAGAYIEAFSSGAVSATYTYSVGGGGNGGGAGASGLAGGNGGSGIIIVEEYYA